LIKRATGSLQAGTCTSSFRPTRFHARLGAERSILIESLLIYELEAL
jgi:hypothetical protein